MVEVGLIERFEAVCVVLMINISVSDVMQMHSNVF